MTAYVADIWRCRYFWLSLVKMDLKARYRRSAVGLGWSLVHPLALTVILYSVFHPIFLSDAPSYALHILTGLVVWNYLTTATFQGCQCFIQAEAYIRQYPSPLAVFPLRGALGGLIHFLLALAVVLAAAGSTVGFRNPPVLLSLLPSVLLLFVLTWCMALLAGFANVLFRDTEHLLQVGFQILFYATPIIYPPGMLDDDRLAWLFQLNPLAAFLRLLRDPILLGDYPSWATFATASGTVLVLAGASVFVLHRFQRRLVFYL